ncbi:asparaginase [Pistricoccus aurantiacus]|uniref:asparaginase n=1 Tax=Pistricoccus aurantiacus TaxID=1883414 RepID=UPI0036435F95
MTEKPEVRVEPPSLLVIHTGGTLCMRPGPDGLTPAGDFEPRLRRALRERPPARRATLPDFDWLEIDPLIDSSAANPGHWQELAAHIAQAYDDYAGFVILHGTDTLSWTAASLAYQLQGIGKPVVLTGAMLPLETPNSDALVNVEGALRFAQQECLKEVALFFAGKLFRGVRARKWHSHQADAFISPNYPPLGEIVDNQAILFSGRGLHEQQRCAPRFELADYRALNETPVARLVLWPGIAAWQLAAWLLDDRLQGAVLELWGGGNIAQDQALLGVLAQACGEGKVIVAITQCFQGGIVSGAYAAGHGLAEAGVIAGDDMTPEAAFTKLLHLLALPLTDQERRQRFLLGWVGER